MIRRAVTLAISVLIVAPSAALAVTQTDIQNLGSATQPTTQVTSSATGDLMRVLLGLVVVVLIIGVLYAVARRAQRGRPPSNRGGAVEVIDTTALSTTRQLHLVKVGDRVLLLGATDQMITRLESFDHDDAIDQGLITEPPLPGEVEPSVARAVQGQTPQRRSIVDLLRERTMR
jgi:flagellar biosynthetic protein FliO